MLANLDDFDSVEDWDAESWDEYFETFHALDFDDDLGYNDEVWEEEDEFWLTDDEF